MTLICNHNWETARFSERLISVCFESFCGFLQSAILFAEAKKDDNIRKFSTDLDNLIENIRSRILDIKSSVRDPVLLNGDTMAMVKTNFNKVPFLKQPYRGYFSF